MATFEKAASKLDEVVSKSEELSDALAQAGQFAAEAKELLTAVMQGAGRLEDEFDQVIQHWSEVAEGAETLVETVATGRRGIDRQLGILRGDAPAPVKSTHVSASELTKAERSRADLPEKVTSGFFFDEEGFSDLVQSGDEKSDEVQEIARHIVELGLVRRRGFASVSAHVEAKVAWRMRKAKVRKVELVINNAICRRGDLTCYRLLPILLLTGQTLVVHDTEKTYTFHGRGTE